MARVGWITRSNWKTRVSRSVVHRCQELPGTRAFRVSRRGRYKPHTIDSSDVNAYLQEISGQPFTAKDFRTWAGHGAGGDWRCGSSSRSIRKRRRRKTLRGCHREAWPNVWATRRPSAASVMSTPAILESYIDGTMLDSLRRNGPKRNSPAATSPELKPEEAAVVGLLRARLKEETQAA